MARGFLRIICCLLLYRTALAQSPAVRFTDITQHSGIHFIHHNGAFGGKYLPETLGPGCAFIDYENDGTVCSSTKAPRSSVGRASLLTLHERHEGIVAAK